MLKSDNFNLRNVIINIVNVVVSVSGLPLPERIWCIEIFGGVDGKMEIIMCLSMYKILSERLNDTLNDVS